AGVERRHVAVVDPPGAELDIGPREPAQPWLLGPRAGDDQTASHAPARLDREIAALVRRHRAREQVIIARAARGREAIELDRRIDHGGIPAVVTANALGDVMG